MIKCKVLTAMADEKSFWIVKFGLLSVVLAWFSFTFYIFAFSVVNRSVEWPIIIQDLPGTLGMGFRTGASFMALVTTLSFFLKKDFSKTELKISLRWVLLFETATLLSFIPSGVYVFIFPRLLVPFWITELTIPVLAKSILIPFVLLKLFFALNPNKSQRNAIKWSLISGTVYLFVFWLDNTGNWLGTIMTKGVKYVTLYPVNLFSFCLTTIGLLLLTLYSARFTKKSIGTEDIRNLDIRKIGFMITALGLYFNVTYFMWLIFGSVGGWSVWYAWFLNHNLDIWLLTAPILGGSLIFQKFSKSP
ncbi:MAG: hypothetical protein ACOC6G_02295 [Thermoproteota archaeon]